MSNLVYFLRKHIGIRNIDMEFRIPVGICVLLAVVSVGQGQGPIQTAFNPEYPFSYVVPPVIEYILNNPNINKSEVVFNSPYANSPREKIGDDYYHRASKCGTHFLNPSEGFVLSDKMFANHYKPSRCVWAFVGSQYCTPSMVCPKFSPRSRDGDCRTNYLQVSDGGESFAYHFCDKERSPEKKTEYTSTDGVLDITYRFMGLQQRPQFECLVRCVPYQVNFTTEVTPNNTTTVKVFPAAKEKKSNLLEPRKSESCRCGIQNNDTLANIMLRNNMTASEKRARILGGRETIVSQYPWMAGLVHKDKVLPFCGASLINDRYVLTAAHCLDDEELDDFVVVLNEHDFHNDSETYGHTIKRGIIEMIPYNHYLDAAFDGDMALLALDRPVDIQKHTMTPICLPADASNDYINYDVIGAGWGTLTEVGKKSPVLLEVLLKVMSNAACNDYHSSKPPIPPQVTKRMMCSGFPEGGKDTCSGDSGGPLVTYENDRFTQIGVTSWGFGCGNRHNPGVFARVTEFLQWIRMHTVDAIYCS